MKIIKVKDFQEAVLKAKGQIFVRFFADWCPYCLKTKADAFKLAEVYENKNIVFVDVENENIWKEDDDQLIGLNVVPTQRIYENGKLIWEKENVMSYQELDNILQKMQ